MATGETMKQVEQICTPVERNNLTDLSQQVGTSRGDFDKKFKDVTSLTNILSGNKPLKADQLKITLEEILKKMIPEIQADAKIGCQDVAQAIQKATQQLGTQESINKYVSDNKAPESAPKEFAWLWNITKYASGMRK